METVLQRITNMKNYVVYQKDEVYIAIEIIEWMKLDNANVLVPFVSVYTSNYELQAFDANHRSITERYGSIYCLANSDVLTLMTTQYETLIVKDTLVLGNNYIH